MEQLRWHRYQQVPLDSKGFTHTDCESEKKKHLASPVHLRDGSTITCPNASKSEQLTSDLMKTDLMKTHPINVTLVFVLYYIAHGSVLPGLCTPGLSIDNVTTFSDS